MPLRILNINIWLMPPFGSVRNKKRLYDLVQLIKDQNPDIVTIQEAWMNHHVRYLRKHLPSYRCFATGGWIFNRSGLVTLVKEEPIAFAHHFFHPIKGSTKPEAVAKKGYHQLDIELFGTTFTVVNTHLYNPSIHIDQYITKHQFMALKKILMNHRNLILSGDLNMTKKFFDRDNADAFFVHDTDESLEAFPPSRYQKLRFNFYEKYTTRVDYTLLHTDIDLEIRTQRIDQPIISDHFAYVTEISQKGT